MNEKATEAATIKEEEQIEHDRLTDSLYRVQNLKYGVRFFPVLIQDADLCINFVSILSYRER